MTDAEALVEEIRDVVSGCVEDDRRVVTRYEGGEFETRMREDVWELYTHFGD